ncbi:ABC transporter permease [Spirochaeta cellobiosiphila]|uniref:ABC transporter permease n=1 Tax=Spirochaeta cellobiosiphila TaxID=504483 RepID=UPI00040F0D64|nr:ABC transporter permease [Spirochaeta cellobiosiphila]
MKGNKLISIFYVVCFLALLYIPIVTMVVYSFNNSELDIGWSGFTLRWYQELLTQSDVFRAFKNTMIVSFVSTFISVLLGAFGAIGFYKHNFRFKKYLDSFLFLPTIVPAMLLGVSMLALYDIFGIPLSKVTIIIAHVTFCTPVTFNTTKVALYGFDKSIEEAAYDLGCNQFQVITKVMLPIIMPAMLSGGLLAFTFSLEDVLTTFFVAGPKDGTLSMYIFGQMKMGIKPTLNALSSLMIVSTVCLGIAAQLLQRRSKKDY